MELTNILNCHVKGVHSFPISYHNNLYRRIFYADVDHELWSENPLSVAIHPHHVDIKILVLEGILYNSLYEKSDTGDVYQSFKWESVIVNNKGGFKHIGNERLSLVSKIGYTSGQTTYMKANELHSVLIERGKICVWLVEEEPPSVEYIPINYSNWDLETWDQSELYQPASDTIKQQYIGKYLTLI